VSEYQLVRSSLKEQSDSIRLDQLTHFAQYILRQRILLSYFFFRLNTTLNLTPLCLACNPDLTTVYKGVAPSLLKGGSVQSRKISVESVLPIVCRIFYHYRNTQYVQKYYFRNYYSILALKYYYRNTLYRIKSQI
jgi:hypothetical protein